MAGEFTLHVIEWITVHHTAVVLEDNADAPARIRQHQEYHQGRGWPDLAYHYVIDAGGNIYEGRPVDAVGDTGTDYDPTGHFLVCCEGDFNQQEITAAQYKSLVQMLAWGSVEFGVDPAAIQGHRDLAATSCPGDSLYTLIADGTLSSDVARATEMVAGLARVCGEAGQQAVAAIESG
ncbi:MAG: N-acetylmuramoyl-L-alanine amidase [bacterium]|nr:N-acetylmuramoyl-L-alanine amidase [bacterium]